MAYTVIYLLLALFSQGDNDELEIVFHVSKRLNPAMTRTLPVLKVLEIESSYRKTTFVHSLTCSQKSSSYTFDRLIRSCDAPPLGTFIVRKDQDIKHLDSLSSLAVSTTGAIKRVSFNKNSTGWKIDYSSRKSILGYTCYKASQAEHATTCWFTPEIPLPYGPDGYSNLPGLVLSVESPRESIMATEIRMIPSTPQRSIDYKRINSAREWNSILMSDESLKVRSGDFPCMP